MTYGTEWVLLEPRTQRFLADRAADGTKITLDEAEIRSGTILWVLVPGEKQDGV